MRVKKRGGRGGFGCKYRGKASTTANKEQEAEDHRMLESPQCRLQGAIARVRYCK